MNTTLVELPEPPTHPAVASPPGRHVASLDGLRALAIMGVMLVHAGAPGLSLGWLGVDLFFVLSGFLITSLLLREFAATGRVNLLNFWGRRFLRLMPAYWLYASFLTIAMRVVHWGWLGTNDGWTPNLYLTAIWCYFVNFVPMGGIWEHQELTLMLWSLAVEEQFYFVWPVLCALVLPTGWMTRVAWALVALILVNWAYTTDSRILNHLSTRGIGIVLGCAFALSLGREASPRARRWLGAPATRFGVLALLAGVIGCATVLHSSGRMDYLNAVRWVVPVVCPLFAMLVAMLWYGPRDWLSTALSWRPLVAVGKISYGMYLYHMLAHYLTWRVLLPGIEAWPRLPKFGLRVIVYLALTTAIATLSYQLIEKRFLVLKERLR
jgi:peptidoglycan/LPS O-acetylase OafA/YrhL